MNAKVEAAVFGSSTPPELDSTLLDAVDREVCESVLIALRFVDELSSTIADGPSDGRAYVRRMRVRLPLPACAAAIQVLAVLLKQARQARDAYAAGEPRATATEARTDARTDVDFTVTQITAQIARRIQARVGRECARGRDERARAAELWGMVVQNLVVTIERAQNTLFGMRVNNN
jgi:hypothetical protein